MSLPPPDVSRPPAWWWPVAILLLLAAAISHFVMIVTVPPLQSANDRSRWCTVRSLLQDHSYQIDRVRQIPGWDTIDLIRQDGHFYSTKPPLMATWVAAITGGIAAVTGWTFEEDFPALHATTLLVINGIPFLACLAGLACWLQGTITSPGWSLYVLAVACFATLLTPFQSTLNNHTVAAVGVSVATFCWLFPAPSSPFRKLLVNFIWGFSACWAACHDLPAAAFTAVMLFDCWKREGLRGAIVFAGGAILPAIAFLTCNAIALGSAFPAYSGYGGETYRFLDHGIPSYWLRPQGVDRNLDSPLVYLMNCTIGHHGWWLLTPVWIFVLAGFSGGSRSGQRPHRLVVKVTLGLSLIVLAFYMTRTGNYNYGGVSCGLRWAIFLTPLWLISLALVVESWTSRTVWGLALLAFAVSAFSAWEPAGRPWQQPWAWKLAEDWGWVPGREPPPPLLRPLYGWIADLPRASAATETPAIWVEFQREEAPDGNERIRLQLQPDERVNERDCAVIDVEQTQADGSTSNRRLRIDRAAFMQGRPPAECLVWQGDNVTPLQQQDDLRFYRALPLLKAYHPGYERYLKLPLRGDAFACQRTASQCDVRENDGQTTFRHRSDLWLSPEIPFGTARMEWTVSDARSGAIVSRQVWVASRCSPPVAPSTPVTVDMFDRPEPIVRQIDRRAVSP